MHEIDVELPSQGCKYCTVKEKQSCWGCCTGIVGLMGLKDNWRWSMRSELKTSAGHDKFLVWPWEWTAEVSTEGTDIKELSSQRTERIVFLDMEIIQNYSRREWQWIRNWRLQVMLRRDSHSSRWLQEVVGGGIAPWVQDSKLGGLMVWKEPRKEQGHLSHFWA